MTPAHLIAHILAMHLAVPEPVTFVVKDLWPSERWAQVIRHGDPSFPRQWDIQFDSVYWRKYPKLRMRVIAHEVCHAAYDYDAGAWDSLFYAERDARHYRINGCVQKLMRDCVVARLGTVISIDAKNSRQVRIRAERQELIEREGK